MVVKKVKKTKKKKPTRSKLIKKLDSVYSQWIRLSKSDSKGICTCVTCGSQMHWKEIQNGHFIGRRYYKYRWMDDNCYPQCVGCNVFRNGSYMEYTRFMQKKFGLDHVDFMIEDKNKIFKVTTDEITELTDYYKDKVKELISQKDKKASSKM